MTEFIIKRAGEPIRYQAVKDDSVLIGRNPDCDLVLRSGIVSGRHARLDHRGDSYELTDIGSRNGTYVNGRRLTSRHRLNHGDEVDIGDFRLTYWIPTPETRTLDQEHLIDVLRVDADAMEIWLGMRRLDLHLRPQELSLLVFLYKNRGRVVTSDEIGEHLWGSVSVDGKNLPQYEVSGVHQTVSRLRRALRPEIDVDRFLATMQGVGYRFEDRPILS